jgi:hypothetical protein
MARHVCRDDLMALSLDTEMQVVGLLHVLASLDISGLLHVDDDTDRYSYRIQLRGRVGPSAQDRAVR